MPALLTPAFGASGFSSTLTISVDFGTAPDRALIGKVFFDKSFLPNSGNVTSVLIDPTGANVSCTIGARRAGSTVLGLPGFVQSFSAVGGTIPTGVKNVVITADNADGAPRAWCQPLNDTTALSAEVVSTGLSLTPSAVVASAAGRKVYALVSSFVTDGQTFTATSPATQATRVLAASAAGFAGAIWQEDGAASVTIDGAYTGSTAQWCMTAFSATGPAAGTPPTITVQPSNQSALVGGTATFNVTATGTGLTYQWRKNGVDIPGANSASYTTPTLIIGDNGALFRCNVVGDTAPPALSNEATLTVTASGNGTLTSSVLRNNTGTLLNARNFSAFVNNATSGALVVLRTGLTSNGAGIVSFTDAALVPGQQYAIRWRDVAASQDGFELKTAT